jgi:hypothetical protein
MEELTTWVVLTGPPRREEVKITAAEESCEAKL